MQNKIERLNLSKQELIQADAKVGWVAAIFILIIGVMVTIGFETGEWKIIGSTMSLPFLSLIILLVALYPKININATSTKKTDYFNNVSIGDNGIKRVDNDSQKFIDDSADKSTEIYSKLSNNKYRLVKIAILISFFWIWPLVYFLKNI